VTLTIHTEEDNQRQLQLTVEVSEERVEKAMRETARKVSRDVRIPGFRPGKAPYHVLLRRIGRDALRGETIEELAPQIFEEALSQEGVEEIYGQPRLDEMTAEPLTLKFTVPLPPHVQLGDYRALRQEIEPVEITDDAIAEALEHVRTHHAVVEPVDRSAEPGDLVTVSGVGQLIRWDKGEDEAPRAEDGGEAETAEADDGEAEFEEGETDDEDDDIIFEHESIELLLDAEKLFPGTPFVEQIVGMAVGEEKSFDISFPEDYEDEELASQEATFDITVLEVKRREMPALDDELAKLEGDYETLEALREDIRQGLATEARDRQREEMLEKMVDDLLAGATLVYPPTAVELELDEMIENFKNQVTRSGWQWEDYLRLQNETEASLRGNFRETAVKRLERNLVLRQFILDEKMTVEAADIDAAIEERLSRFDNEELRQGMRDYFSQGYGFNTISSQVLQEKVYERMEAILAGNAPDLAVVEAASAEASARDEEE
jgi:trigger factor